MISKNDLKEMAMIRFKDSEVLFQNRRYNGTIYLGGYVIELLLKYNICKSFNFISGYPETKTDLYAFDSEIFSTFKSALKNINLSSYKTHDLNKLLKISGKEFEINNLYLNEWSNIILWSPGIRYKSIIFDKHETQNFIESINIISGILN